MPVEHRQQLEAFRRSAVIMAWHHQRRPWVPLAADKAATLCPGAARRPAGSAGMQVRHRALHVRSGCKLLVIPTRDRVCLTWKGQGCGSRVVGAMASQAACRAAAPTSSTTTCDIVTSSLFIDLTWQYARRLCRNFLANKPFVSEYALQEVRSCKFYWMQSGINDMKQNIFSLTRYSRACTRALIS